MVNSWRLGIGVGATLLGTYISLISIGKSVEVIVGIAFIAFGIALISSS
ncbi:MAG: hypothetical protein AABX65_03625 [Nanoarchaeota archaeon]